MKEVNKEWVSLLPAVQETVNTKWNYQKEWKHEAEPFQESRLNCQIKFDVKTLSLDQEKSVKGIL